jgi:Ca2+-binding RTX toxin-like protein
MRSGVITMANVRFGNLLDDYQLLSNLYTGDLDLGKHGAKSATFADTDQHNMIVMTGTGFRFSQGSMTAGHVDKVVFENSAGDVLATVSKAGFDAGTVLDIIETKGMEAGLAKVLAGKDSFTGSSHGDYIFGYGGADKLNGGAGDDALNGGGGNDHLTGGTGSDVFLFSVKGGHDVVTDFDADGGGKKQDYINLESDTHYKILKSGHDTIVDLGHGDTLTLLGVDHTHVTKADFDMV